MNVVESVAREDLGLNFDEPGELHCYPFDWSTGKNSRIALCGHHRHPESDDVRHPPGLPKHDVCLRLAQQQGYPA
jgi:hypothetical protein